MKMKKEHQQKIGKLMTKFWLANLEAVKEAKLSHTERRLMNVIYLKSVDWDLRQEVYQYLNDDNLNTFFKKLHKQLEEVK